MSPPAAPVTRKFQELLFYHRGGRSADLFFSPRSRAGDF
jgi:hypothetical protein